MTEEPLTWEKLQDIWDQFKTTPHLRIIVSKWASSDQCVELPKYYDKKLCRDVRTIVMGENFWRRLLKETTISSDMQGVFGVPIEFSPPSWRPLA